MVANRLLEATAVSSNWLTEVPNSKNPLAPMPNPPQRRDQVAPAQTVCCSLETKKAFRLELMVSRSSIRTASGTSTLRASAVPSPSGEPESESFHTAEVETGKMLRPR